VKTYEYEITRHGSEEFAQVAFYCSAEGDCSINDVPEAQSLAPASLLNSRGREGWELVQMAFGRTGFMAFWKREIT